MKIDVTDFQGIGRASLTAEGLTVIVGPSDRGKSALLRAIEAALFNRAGDGFVRLGQPSAAVSLSLNGQPDGTHTIQWTKGGGKNEFTIDGTRYAKVGREAPPPLKAFGFRDEVIGGRVGDSGKLEGGEPMRPQVARQFDPIFLLDRPGAFLHEVMVKLSRLGVLQQANRACSADLRAAKSTLQLQQGQAREAREAAEHLQPVGMLRLRVTDLMERLQAAQAQHTRLVQVRSLLQQRQAVAALAAVRLPAAKRPTPKWLTRAAQVLSLRVLLADRSRVGLRILALPPVRPENPAMNARLQRYLALWPVAVAHSKWAVTVAQLAKEAQRREDEYDRWGKALADLKARVKTCPVCDRPF